MKHIYSFALFVACILSVASLNAQTTVVLSPTTCTSSSGDASPWSFEGGYSITNTGSKTYGTGSISSPESFTGMKCSSLSTTWAVVLPDTIQVTKVNFYGYDNYNTGDSWLYDFNGTTPDSASCSFPMKDASSAVVSMGDATVTPTDPITGSFTYSFGGKQVVIAITLTVETKGSSSIQESTQDALDPDGKTSVYGIDGKLIRSGVTRSSATAGLSKGIYIIDNKKVAVTD